MGGQTQWHFSVNYVTWCDIIHGHGEMPKGANNANKAHTKRSDMDHTAFSCQLHHACLFFVSVHQMAPPLTEVSDIRLQLTSHLSTPKDERLSWPGWLNYSGWFTDIWMVTHQRQVERRIQGSLPAEDRRSTSVLRNRPSITCIA